MCFTPRLLLSLLETVQLSTHGLQRMCAGLRAAVAGVAPPDGGGASVRDAAPYGARGAACNLVVCLDCTSVPGVARMSTARELEHQVFSMPRLWLPLLPGMQIAS